MQIASRQLMWGSRNSGTVVEVEMTEETGRDIRFFLRTVGSEPFSIDWGDGTRAEFPFRSADIYESHTYARLGRYRICFRNVSDVGFRMYDDSERFSYDAAPISVVDYSGILSGIASGAFWNAKNLERYIAPGVKGVGQRPFAYCTKLKEVKLGEVEVHYDGSFLGCSALERFESVSTGCCWSYVWQGCTRLPELRLGSVSQFATDDFVNTPNLMDIWISDKTVEQIKQVAPEGNIESGYGAPFPWGANAGCRFHGTNGIVLGDGTIIHG